MTLDTVSLGSTGLTASELALGTARFGSQQGDSSVEIDRETAFSLLDTYADAGGNFIDTADIYGDGAAEEYIGEWLQTRERDRFVLASKIYWPTREDDPNSHGLNRKHLRRQIEQILSRLGTDYLDLLYIHRWDDSTPAREFMRTLDGFVASGRVHYLGASNRRPNAWQVAKANEIARKEGYEPFSTTQILYNLVDRQIEREFVPMCKEYNLGVVPFSPLAGGFLTGKYERGQSPPTGSRGAREERFRERYFGEQDFDVVERVEEVAADLDVTPVGVSLAWLLSQSVVVSPVIGPQTVPQLTESLNAAEISLSRETIDYLGKPDPLG